MLEQIEEAAHALAYIIVTDRRFTDLYHWGNRTATVTLAAEIQRQLLPLPGLFCAACRVHSLRRPWSSASRIGR
ncbi:hypothetical protein [Streptomyces sp. DHE17-7]|uniref:hypothetical protein n=1 Tax=Streptomyces sp. DHE17-7 TaxID=2759949 RepID=UPI003FA6823D